MNLETNAATAKKIIIVDDHEMMLLGLKNFIEEKTEHKVSGSAKTISDAKVLLNKENADIIIIDVDLGDESGFNLALFVKETYPELKIIMYSMHEETGYVLKARHIGANGYISKASASEEFIKCINIIASGNDYVEEKLFEKKNKIDDVLVLLTKREAQIFTEMLNEKSNEEIANTMNISKHSVEVYVTNIYEKTFCKNRTEFLQKYK